jgi:hypothetical protein
MYSAINKLENLDKKTVNLNKILLKKEIKLLIKVYKENLKTK